MTKFDKDQFSFHGGYLMYHGPYEGQKTYGEVYGPENCHPTRVDMPKEIFIARFKYRGAPITMSQFKKQLIKRFTVEQYVAAYETGKAPLVILEEDDFQWYRKLMNKAHGREVYREDGTYVSRFGNEVIPA